MNLRRSMIRQLDPDDAGAAAGGWARVLGGGWIFLLLIILIFIFSLLRPTQFGSAYNLSMLAINAPFRAFIA